MSPGEGYMLKSASIGDLIYPSGNGNHIKLPGILSAKAMAVSAPAWSVNPVDYEHSMNITGVLNIDGVLNVNRNTLLAAFANDVCCGISKPVLVVDRWMYFLTVYEHENDGPVEFRAWDAAADQIHTVSQLITFKADTVIGSPRIPFTWSSGIPLGVALTELDVPQEFALKQNSPNPFNPSTRIRYALKQPANTRLVLYDNLGRVVKVLVEEKQKAGWYEVEFYAGDLASGVYFYRLDAGPLSKIRKMLLIK